MGYGGHVEQSADSRVGTWLATKLSARSLSLCWDWLLLSAGCCIPRPAHLYMTMGFFLSESIYMQKCYFSQIDRQTKNALFFMIAFHGRLALYIYRCIFPYKWKREGRSLCNLTVLMDICHVRLNAQSYNTERKVQEVRLYIFIWWRLFLNLVKNDQMYQF